MLRELEKYAPKVLWACRRALEEASRDVDFLRLNADAFEKCPSISIDYAVLEKTACAAVLPVEMGWRDIGSWTALWEFMAKDEAGNAHSGDVMLRDAQNCLVNAQSRLVVALGVRDLIVVETADAVLVAHQTQAQNVKQVVEELQKQGRSEAEN
jgi:mannose-1-phosphate guanylyltransferase